MMVARFHHPFHISIKPVRIISRAGAYSTGKSLGGTAIVVSREEFNLSPQGSVGLVVGIHHLSGLSHESWVRGYIF